VAFVGALGADVNKGFDLLLDAWNVLSASGDWDARLVVAGGGSGVARWRTESARSNAGRSTQFLGFTPRIREVLAAADLLVSPVRYEAYGLNVHEALCCGVAVMVTRTAGVVERFDTAMAEALLPEAITATELAARLRAWREDMNGWRDRSASTAARIRSRSWEDMASEFVDLVQQAPRRIPA
jgi:glycosyltransferase involved in cell wall biosynthesis